ncbi:alginate export family protein [Hydrocarboniphaga effusa]|uniref:alginate export family protein n=1 Tax=Hydrocarboniphaga effusa TaxID=243629 RepID=UPI0035B44720
MGSQVCGMLLLALAALSASGFAQAQTRPAIESNRWHEDWSALADPDLRTQPLDDLKYLALPALDPQAYLSLGANLRERLVTQQEPAFGIGREGDSYLLQRAQLHADLHFDEHWRAFAQIEDVRAFDRKAPAPTDDNRFDLRLAFLMSEHRLGDGLLKTRVGRQDFLFDLQRFVSLRDGPNLRQSFDAIWADYELEPWRLIGFLSRPVQYRDDQAFDDRSDRHFVFHTLRLERHVLGDNELSGYYSRYELDDAGFLDASGNERRDVFDLRFAGKKAGLDWDFEGMWQSGRVGDADVRAWAVGAKAGYSLASMKLKPRIGLQADAASGDRKAGDGRLQTFNPLFPNGGYYFSDAGYTGYVNLIHVKPSLTITPAAPLKLAAALGLQWRQTASDAVYVQPDVPVRGTVGEGGRWTGAYLQLRADWKINAQLSAAVEGVHYDVGQALRAAGGQDSDYLGAEFKFAW